MAKKHCVHKKKGARHEWKRYNVANMVAMQFGRVDEYKESKEDFESYIERFEQWLLANDIANEKKEIQDSRFYSSQTLYRI